MATSHFAYNAVMTKNKMIETSLSVVGNQLSLQSSLSTSIVSEESILFRHIASNSRFVPFQSIDWH